LKNCDKNQRQKPWENRIGYVASSW
jgi:hypothetical protein